MPVPFNSLKAQLASMETELKAAFERVLERAWYLLGPEVAALEKKFTEVSGTAWSLSAANGTEALAIALRALDLSPGDEVILPSFTAPPCYHAVLAAGLTPVFAEVEEPYYTLDPESVRDVCGEKTRAVMAVHLYGGMCDMDALTRLCEKKDLFLIEDCAQAHGAKYKGKRAGSFGDLCAFSFYPTKNMGALGDAGMVCGQDQNLRQKVSMIRQYGEKARYLCETPGVNSRMDEIQAAFLLVRLKHLEEQNAQRRRLAGLYQEGLADTGLVLPVQRPGTEHVHHLYAVRCQTRDELAAHLKARDIGTAVHYPRPGHAQPMFTSGKASMRRGDLALTERLADEILSLPLFPGLGEKEAHEVIAGVREFFSAGA